MSEEPAAHEYDVFVGIDIAATSATVSWLRVGSKTSKPQTVAQTPEGFTHVTVLLGKTGVAAQRTLVVMEATGAYWASLATFLVRSGYVVSVINPLQAHHFARALLKRAKTDAIDAQMLACLAATLRPTPWTPPPALYEELYQRLAQRDALLGIQNQVRNQRHALRQGPVVVASVLTRLESLDQQLSGQIAEIESELVDILHQVSPETPEAGDWGKTITYLQTIPGIGLLTALWIVVSTLNFTLCQSAEQATAYAGLAPIPRQSGTSVNKRPCIGHSGNERLRTALYLATLSGTRYNPTLKTFYERLLAKGKPKKAARCAAARKLLHVAWAIGTKQETYMATWPNAAA